MLGSRLGDKAGATAGSHQWSIRSLRHCSRFTKYPSTGMFVTYLHRNWTFAQTDLVGKEIGTTKVEWLPAQVPGHVHLDLQAAGVIGDPFYRLNEIGVQWVDRADWSYQTTFDWTAIPDYGKRVLRFEGLDTVCSVFLNGEKVAEHDNMHVPLEVDVTDKLKEGENHLRIDFQSAVNVGEARMAAYKEEKGYGVIDRLLERSFVRKVQCMFGWDWGPRLVSAGVWKPVQLLEYAERIDDVHVTQTHHEDGTVTLHFKSTAEGEGTIRHLLFGPDGQGVGIIEGEGDPKVPQPNLWGPHGGGRRQSRGRLRARDREVLPGRSDPHSQRTNLRVRQRSGSKARPGASARAGDQKNQ